MSTELDLDDVAAQSPLAQRELAALRAERDALKQRLEDFDVVGLAYSQRELPGPFGGVGTQNSALDAARTGGKG